MKPSANHILKALTTGFVTLTLLTIPLFWARYTCDSLLRENTPRKARQMQIMPSKMLPDEIETDPNVDMHSSVDAHFSAANAPIGYTEYFIDRTIGGQLSNTYRYEQSPNRIDRTLICFDKDTGLIRYESTYVKRLKNDHQRITKHLYAGPNAIAEKPDKKLGRFVEPLDLHRYHYLIVFDRKMQRFFKIDFRQRTVLKGPEIKKNSHLDPIPTGSIFYDHQSRLNCTFQSPREIMAEPNDRDAIHEAMPYFSRSKYRDTATISSYSVEPYLPILHPSGRIELLDTDTLQIKQLAGWLPSPRNFLSSHSSKPARPKELLEWRIFPLVLEPDNEYLGLVAAALNRDGTAVAMATFDKNASPVWTEYSNITKVDHGREYKIPSADATYSETPLAPTLTITKYLLENLHPLALSAASFLTADNIEAKAGHHAIFLIPNSFFAMHARSTAKHIFDDKYYIAVLMLLPSIILSAWLALRVAKHARLIGLSPNAKLTWILATFAFGLTA